MVAQIEQKCLLSRCFADFGLLPDLLALHPETTGAQTGTTDTFPGNPDPLGMAMRWMSYLGRSGVNTEHIEPDDLDLGPSIGYYLANDAWALASNLGLVEGEVLTGPGRRLAEIGRTPWKDRTGADDHAVEDIIAARIRERYIGGDGLNVVNLLTRGAAHLARTDHVWASYIPGLLLAEFEALIYWAFERPDTARTLCGQLVQYRDVAMHRHGPPSPDVAPEENLLRHADATTALYYETAALAARSELTVTDVRSTAMLLTYAGLLEEFSMGPVNYLYPPKE